jgi:hypothetical protein
MNFSGTKAFLVLMLSGTLLCAIGCSDSGSTQLRVLHASPDAPNVDVLYSGTTLLTNVAYSDASAYLKVKAGSRRIEVRATGDTTDVIDASPDFSKDRFYTVIVGNDLMSITPLVYLDEFSAPASGQVKVRFIHAAPGAQNVDIYVGAPGSGTTGTPAVTNLAYQSATSYLSVPAGSYQAYITLTGSKTIAIDSGVLNLSNGQVRTAVALGDPAVGKSLSAVVLSDLN